MRFVTTLNVSSERSRLTVITSHKREFPELSHCTVVVYTRACDHLTDPQSVTSSSHPAPRCDASDARTSCTACPLLYNVLVLPLLQRVSLYISSNSPAILRLTAEQTFSRPRAACSRAALQKTRTTKNNRRAPPGLLLKSQCQQGPRSILSKRPSHRTSAATRCPYGGAALSLQSSETLSFRTRTSRAALALMVCGPCWLLLLVLQCDR